MKDPKDLKDFDIFKPVDKEFLATIKLVSFSHNGKNALFITFDDKVYAIGENKHGQHGVGDKEPSTEPRRVDALCNKEVVTFSFGLGHVLAVSKDGKLFSWGGNSNGQLGNNSTVENLIPTLIESLKGKRINSIECGEKHSLVLTEDGEIYAFGSNDLGQIGDGTNIDALVPKQVNFELPSDHSRPVQVASGFGFSMMRLNTGKILGWGCNRFGQLGLGHRQGFEPTPCHVEKLGGLANTKIACGMTYVLDLSESGHIYSWGENSDGQLGNGTFEQSSLPKRIAEEEGPFYDIAAFHHSNLSAAISQLTKTCYIWGDTRDGKVNRPKRTECMSIPEAFLLHSKCNAYPGEITFSANSFKAHFKWAFNNKEMSNVTFEVDGQKLYAFREVLMIRSEHFRTKEGLQGTTKDQPIQIRDVSYTVYKAFLYYLYTDEVELESEEDIFELWYLARSYLQPELKEKCELLLMKAITEDTVALLYVLSLKYKAKRLETACLHYLVKNKGNNVETEAFSYLDQEACMKLFKSIFSKQRSS